MTQRDELISEIVGLLATMGGVRTEELAFQLHRLDRPITGAQLVDLLYEAESAGLITPYAWTLGPEAER